MTRAMLRRGPGTALDQASLMRLDLRSLPSASLVIEAYAADTTEDSLNTVIPVMGRAVFCPEAPPLGRMSTTEGT